jgi:DNA-binding NtrC family response regulator
VYGIVKQSGGFIWVYSEPGMGTTFRIYFPQVDQKSDPLTLARPAEKSPRGWETLLLAEDEAAVRQSEREFLEASGYTVLEAHNGDDALRVARNYSGTIHLMITDVVMPCMDGAKLAEQLSSERPEMKVLFVSGYAENTVLQHGAIDIAGQFLQKPFTLKSLARKIREALGSGEMTRAAASSG